MIQSAVVEDKSSELLVRLREKLEPEGQNVSCHLEGLVHANYLTYWDYIQTSVLLNIQQPRTGFPDENIFIIYHQITELYFKMILQELDQLTTEQAPAVAEFTLRVRRINRYFDNLVYSFNIMVDGFDKDQFMLFRTALAPASGFQSLQYRLIEIAATDMKQLVTYSKRSELSGVELPAELYDQFYWKLGATDIHSGRKDLSLVSFEKKYDNRILEKALAYKYTNLNFRAECLIRSGQANAELISELRKMDQTINVQWRLAHFRTASKYLNVHKSVRATGGTNWREYLPPRFQNIIFFPSIWTENEKAEWGRSFVDEMITQPK